MAPDSGLDRWYPGTYYAKGERIIGSHGRVQIAICNGMSGYGASGVDEPYWPEMEGCTTLDGTLVWKCEGFPLPEPPQWALELMRPDYDIIEEREV